MLKILKYELKNTYKSIVSIISAFIVAALIISVFKEIYSDNNVLGSIYPGLIQAVAFIMCLTFIGWSINRCGKEIHDDNNIILFNTANRYSKIIMGKILIDIIYMAIIVLIAVFLSVKFGALKSDRLADLLGNKIIYMYGYMFVFSLTNMLLIVTIGYFSIILSKSLFYNRKTSKVFAGVFIYLIAILVITIAIYLIWKYNFGVQIPTNPANNFKGTIQLFSPGAGSLVFISPSEVRVDFISLIVNMISSAVMLVGTAFVSDKKLQF